MVMRIDEIEGIGPKYSQMLRDVGIKSTATLLEAGATRKGRERLSEKLGIRGALILRWVNLCDLCRVSGVSTQYSELLEAAGVDTVKELRSRNAENLYARMRDVNAAKKLVRQPPALKNVAKWVDQAKNLDPVVSY